MTNRNFAEICHTFVCLSYKIVISEYCYPLIFSNTAASKSEVHCLVISKLPAHASICTWDSSEISTATTSLSDTDRHCPTEPDTGFQYRDPIVRKCFYLGKGGRQGRKSNRSGYVFEVAKFNKWQTDICPRRTVGNNRSPVWDTAILESNIGGRRRTVSDCC